MYIAVVNIAMLSLERVTQNTDNSYYSAVIVGPMGRIELSDLVWIEDRADILEVYYWAAWAVLQGAYDCCWSAPGKVQLLTA